MSQKQKLLRLKKQAETAFSDTNLGELSDIDGEDIIAEDESGDDIWERQQKCEKLPSWLSF